GVVGYLFYRAGIRFGAAMRGMKVQRWPGGEPLDTPCVEGEEKGKAAGEMERGGWGLLSESAGARICQASSDSRGHSLDTRGLQGELISAFLSPPAAGPAVHKARGCHTHSSKWHAAPGALWHLSAAPGDNNSSSAKRPGVLSGRSPPGASRSAPEASPPPPPLFVRQ
ncbi:hypothetical protein KUCAC02_025355, partial [Chaenocephalus aceratus]